MPFFNSDFSFCDILDFAVGVSVLYDEVTPLTFTTIFPFLGTKTTSFSHINGTVVVVGHNLHKLNKCHLQ